MCSDQECRCKNFGVKLEKNIAFSNEATIYKIVRFPKSVGEEKKFFITLLLNGFREIHPLEPQRHRHSMLAPRVCAPRVTRCSLGHVI